MALSPLSIATRGYLENDPAAIAVRGYGIFDIIEAILGRPWGEASNGYNFAGTFDFVAGVPFGSLLPLNPIGIFSDVSNPGLAGYLLGITPINWWSYIALFSELTYEDTTDEDEPISLGGQVHIMGDIEL